MIYRPLTFDVVTVKWACELDKVHFIFSSFVVVTMCVSINSNVKTILIWLNPWHFFPSRIRMNVHCYKEEVRPWEITIACYTIKATKIIINIPRSNQSLMMARNRNWIAHPHSHTPNEKKTTQMAFHWRFFDFAANKLNCRSSDAQLKQHCWLYRNIAFIHTCRFDVLCNIQFTKASIYFQKYVKYTRRRFHLDCMHTLLIGNVKNSHPTQCEYYVYVHIHQISLSINWPDTIAIELFTLLLAQCRECVCRLKYYVNIEKIRYIHIIKHIYQNSDDQSNSIHKHILQFRWRYHLTTIHTIYRIVSGKKKSNNTHTHTHNIFAFILSAIQFALTPSHNVCVSVCDSNRSINSS